MLGANTILHCAKKNPFGKTALDVDSRPISPQFQWFDGSFSPFFTITFLSDECNSFFYVHLPMSFDSNSLTLNLSDKVSFSCTALSSRIWIFHSSPSYGTLDSIGIPPILLFFCLLVLLGLTIPVNFYTLYGISCTLKPLRYLFLERSHFLRNPCTLRTRLSIPELLIFSLPCDYGTEPPVLFDGDCFRLLSA